jgi:hypothetical protein
MNEKNISNNLKAIETYFQNINVDNCDTHTIMHEQHKLLIDKLVYSDDFMLHSRIRLFVSKVIVDEYPEFLSSPASSKYHGCEYGGLFNHSLLVYKNALLMHKFYKVDEVNFIACMFHDLCKSNRYKLASDNSDNKYVINDKYVGIEHGAESLRRLYMMVPGIDTTLVPEPWQLAIAYHMGVFGVSETEMKNFSKYSEMYPEVLLLHHCDMVATKIDKI